MNGKQLILTVNPGSTSTKIAVFENDARVHEKKLVHTADELSVFKNVMEQRDFRKDAILKALAEFGVSPQALTCVVGRGGLVGPVKSGVYIIDEKMMDILKSASYGEHASNLGALLAHDIASPHGLPAYIADPVVVDELQDIARLSGHPGIKRISIFHALNHKAVVRRAARQLGKRYEECNFVVAHMGGGVSVAAHKRGKCIDLNNALGGEGPYSPERAGGMPAFDLVEWCYSGASKGEVKKRLVGRGGFVAYLDTNDTIEIAERVKNGDEYAKLVLEGMAYQTAKEIGAYATVLKGDVDAIVLTGGIAYDGSVTGFIEEYVGFIAPVMVFPGEDEMLALCEGALRVLEGKETANRL